MVVKYAVRTWGGCTYMVQAESSTAAKKLVCKLLGRRASAPLVGVKGMMAKKIP